VLFARDEREVLRIKTYDEVALLKGAKLRSLGRASRATVHDRVGIVLLPAIIAYIGKTHGILQIEKSPDLRSGDEVAGG
jgi:hypothetical protein